MHFTFFAASDTSMCSGSAHTAFMCTSFILERKNVCHCPPVMSLLAYLFEEASDLRFLTNSFSWYMFLWQRDKHKQGEGLVPPIVSFQSGGEVPRGQHCIISIHKMSWTTLVLWLACLLFYFCIWHWSPEDAGCNLSCTTPADIERAVTHV